MEIRPLHAMSADLPQHPDDGRQAFPGSCMVMAILFLAFTGHVIFREPMQGLAWLMGTNFCATAALSEETAFRRAKSLAVNLFLFGTLQFFLSALSPHRFLMMGAVALMIWVLTLRSHANQAGAVLSAALLNIQPTDFQQGINVWALACCIGIAGAPLFYFLDRLLFSGTPWRGTGFQPQLPRDAVVRKLAAILFALTLYYAFDWTFGSWIAMTVILSYTSGRTGRAVWQLAAFRLRWALTGFLLSVLYLSTISYTDSSLNDAAALLLFAAAYFSLRAKIYVNYYLLFVLSMSFIKNIAYADSPVYGNGWLLVVQSTAAVLIGVAVVALAEAPVPIDRTSPVIQNGIRR